MNISWEELLKNRKPMMPVVNSAHMLECIKAVQAKFPNAKIEEVEKGKLWRLVSGEQALSNPRNSHYACWAEAREVIDVANNQNTAI